MNIIINKNSRESIAIIEDVGSDVIEVNFEFSDMYKLKWINKFRNSITHDNPREKALSGHGLWKLKRYARSRKKIEEYHNLGKFREELEKFLGKTLKEESRVNFQTPKYKDLSSEITILENRMKLLKGRSEEKEKELKIKIKSLDYQRKKIRNDLFNIFKNLKNHEFAQLGDKLWNLWDQMEHYFIYREKRIQFKIYDLEMNLRGNSKLIKKKSKKKNKFALKIEELRALRNKYKNPYYIIELAKNIEDLSSIIKKYEKYFKKEIPKKISEKKFKKVLKKLKSEEDLKSDKHKSESSLGHYLCSNALISSSVSTRKKDKNEISTLYLEFDIQKTYEAFIENLKMPSENGVLVNKPYTFKDSYLFTHYNQDKLESLLNKTGLIQKNFIRIKRFNDFLGFKLDLIEIAETLFRDFSKKHPRSKHSKRSIHFKKPQFNTKNIVIGAVSTISILLIIFGLVQPFLSSSQTVVIQKYDLVKIDYQIWESDARRNYNIFNPSFDDTIWITMVPITENSTSGLILGLYTNLLGKQKYFESGLIWLDKCIDQDRNGIDDLSGEPALSFGNSTDLHFNTYLMIKFTVLDIQKM